MKYFNDLLDNKEFDVALEEELNLVKALKEERIKNRYKKTFREKLAIKLIGIILKKRGELSSSQSCCRTLTYAEEEDAIQWSSKCGPHARDWLFQYCPFCGALNKSYDPNYDPWSNDYD